MTRAKLACLLLSLFPLLGMGDSQESKKVSTVPDFAVEGIGFTQCQCTAYACPCRSNGHPTHGSCNAADFASIQRGYYGKVKLDGLKALVVGDMDNVKPELMWATIYFDQTTTPAQREAFTALYKYMLGGWVGGPTDFLKGSKIVPIQFTESPDKTEYTLTIPGILEEKAVLKRSKDGKPLHALPARDQWGNVIHYADNVVFKYYDKELGKQWDLSGRQANVKYFRTTSQMYAKKELLMQHSDHSGTWTEKQKQIIRAMGMKPE
jgi:hypothetical protein